MIRDKTLRKMGLSDEQIEGLSDLLRRESRLREIIVNVGISPKVTEKIMRKCNAELIDLDNEQGLKETITEVYGDFIVQK